MLNIKPASEIDAHLKLLVYGGSGSGKTQLAVTAQQHPDLADVLVVNIEEGLLTIRTTGVDVTDKVTRSQDVLDLLTGFLRKDENLARYKTLVIDSATELEAIVLPEVCSDHNMDIEKADARRLYGAANKRQITLYRMLRDLPMHVIITALVREEKTESGTVTRVRPALSNGAANALMGFVNCTWYLDVIPGPEGHRGLLTSKQPPYEAKTRGPAFAEALGAQIQNPNLAEIYTLYRKTLHD
jgi:hypothetical protein